MRTRRRHFASLDRDGRRNNRKASSRRIAKIDAILNINELDVFAGMAADLYEDLARYQEDHIALVEDLRNHKMNVERALRDAKEGLKQVTAQIKAFNSFEILMDFEALSKPLNDISDGLNEKIAELEQEVRFQTKELDVATKELEDTEADPMGEALAELLKDLDQDDTVNGLQAFSSALGDLIGEVGEDFLADILGGSDGSRMLDFMERIGF